MLSLGRSKVFLIAFKLLAPETRTLQHLISNVIARSRDMALESSENAALITHTGTKDNKRDNKKNSRDNKEKKKGNCNYCKKPGHWARECKKLQKKKEKEGDNEDNKKKTDKEEKNEEKKTEDVVSFMASIMEVYKLDWIADSGCSLHMTPNLHWLVDYEVLQQPKEVRFGNNHKTYALGFGSVITSVGVMRNVYYVPNLAANLFSVTAATARGVEIKYTNR